MSLKTKWPRPIISFCLCHIRTCRLVFLPTPLKYSVSRASENIAAEHDMGSAQSYRAGLSISEKFESPDVFNHCIVRLNILKLKITAIRFTSFFKWQISICHFSLASAFSKHFRLTLPLKNESAQNAIHFLLNCRVSFNKSIFSEESLCMLDLFWFSSTKN